MSDVPTSDMLQALEKSLSARFQSVETFLMAIGTHLQGQDAPGRLGAELRQLQQRVGMLDVTAEQGMEDILFSLGQMRCREQSQVRPIRDLSDVEFKVFSQWGEDGIIDWIVARLPTIPRTFVEFGVEDFHEANCRFLMRNRGWKGLVIDGSEANMAALRLRPEVWQNDLTAVQAFVTAENINDLLTEFGFGGEIGILSIDIDGNDYWVWDQIAVADPAIVICEMNAVMGDVHPVTIPYDPGFERLTGHHSGQYFGASVAALRHLGDEKGYEFIGTNSRGVNAFFVRRDLAAHVLPLVESRRAYPSLHRDSRDANGYLTFLAGQARFDAIRHLPVVDVITGRTVQLSDLSTPYSPDWQAAMAYRPLDKA